MAVILSSDMTFVEGAPAQSPCIPRCIGTPASESECASAATEDTASSPFHPMDAGGAETEEMVVVNEYVRRPGEEAIKYTRTYRRVEGDCETGSER